MTAAVPLAAGLVLAAGEGQRFGRPKALVEIDGERLVDRAVRLLADGGCEPIVVVAGAVPIDVSGVPDGAAGAIWVVDNTEWGEGLGSTLRAGLRALSGAAKDGDSSPYSPPDAVVVTLVDQPWLGSEAVRRLRAARAGGAFVAVATYGGERGNPVLLGREVWADVAVLACGDVGARAFIVAHPELVTAVPCDDTGQPDDVDRPEDLLR